MVAIAYSDSRASGPPAHVVLYGITAAKRQQPQKVRPQGSAEMQAFAAKRVWKHLPVDLAALTHGVHVGPQVGNQRLCLRV